MVKLKNDNLKLHDSLIIDEDMNDPCRHSEKLLRLANSSTPVDVEEFFDALDEDCEEFVKRVWGDNNDNDNK